MPTSAPSIASLATIRRQFPALKRRHGGLPVAHFDGPGGTQVPKPVITAVSDYLAHHNANTHWAFPTSNETDAMLAGARQIVGDFLNASPAEIAFGANMTTLAFHLARALGRGWGPGDEVVVTELDHHGNVAPWESLVRERGISLRTLPLSPGTGTLDLSLLESLLTSRTRLVAIGAASNALGTITDVRRAADLAHAAGARCFVDAVHYAPHALVDVRALDCDFLACSAYKFYGPHIGILYGRLDLLEELDVPKLRPAPDTAPERLETGTQNHEGIAGAAAAVEFLAGLGQGTTRRERLAVALAGLHARSERLLRRLWRGLGKLLRHAAARGRAHRDSHRGVHGAGPKRGEVAHHLASLGGSSPRRLRPRRSWSAWDSPTPAWSEPAAATPRRPKWIDSSRASPLG
jgi:cysteine desulfurase family protein (TIGR01976 family)